jgi:N-succinyldiaminopimelate aminotransferase
MSHAVQRASIAAWNDEEHVRENRRLYAAKFAQVLPLLERTSLKTERPAGGFYLWVRAPADDMDFARRLYGQYNVLVLPGSFLAREARGTNPGRNHVRVALVAPLEECVEAAGRIAEFARKL